MKRPSCIWKLVGIFCLYALLGPPIGGVLFFIVACFMMEDMFSSSEWVSLLAMMLIFSYLPGGLPALLAAIVTCTARFFRERVSFISALLVGGGVALAYYLVTERFLVSLLSFGAALVCWGLARRWRLL